MGHLESGIPLFKLLTRKKVDQSFITNSDMKSYGAILEATHGHLENNDRSVVIKTTRGAKYKDIIFKLFPRAGSHAVALRVLRRKSGQH